MVTLAPNIDLLFTDRPTAQERVRAAAEAGFEAVEMWGSFEKDVPALADALQETGLRLTALLAEPRHQFMLVDDHAPFYEGLARGVEAARELGCPRIVVGSGTGFGGQSRQTQLERLVEIYGEALSQIEGDDVTLVLEAVNTRVDHPGALLDRTAEAAWVARQIDDPRFGILHDLYHSTVEGEDVPHEIAAAGDLIRYVQIADVPGRGEPGSGHVDWSAPLVELERVGYRGDIGLEFRPTTDSVAALRRTREALSA